MIGRRITFVVPEISSGGAEHALVIIARSWVAKGREVTILTLDDGSSAPFYELEPNIAHFPLALAGDSANPVTAVRNNLRRLLKLRGAIRRQRPDVVVSFIDQTNVLTLLATAGLRTPVVAVEQSDPRTFPLKPVWDRLRTVTYRGAARVVLLSSRDAEYFSSRIRKRVRVITNPFLPPPVVSEDSLHDERNRRLGMIAIGRLHRDKGFDVLLKSLSLLKESHPEWHLTVLGEGQERERLEKMRDELKLSETVSFVGRVKDPYRFLRQADLFVMPSRTEGFPLALCEALACGLPVVCTDCSGGVRDIIQNGINGVLVPAGDPPALAQALGRLMTSEVERQRLSRSAPEVLDRFGMEKVMEAWEALLREVVTTT